jgi:hypothetical protein
MTRLDARTRNHMCGAIYILGRGGTPAEREPRSRAMSELMQHAHELMRTAGPSMHLPPAAFQAIRGGAVFVIGWGGAQAGGQQLALPRRLLEQGQVFIPSAAVGPADQAEQHIGRYASEEDAARAYDCAAVQAHGPGARRNFPDETISEPPVTVGEQKKQRSSSRYVGVSWYKARSSHVKARSAVGPADQAEQHIGRFASEENAARAYDCAAVQAHGPGAKRNFPAEAISELPVTVGKERILH